MRVLVCGGRDYADRAKVFDELEVLNAFNMNLCVISGGAFGADALAEEWARSNIKKRNGVSFRGFKADWNKHGKAAGPIRNQRMIDDGKPDLVLAFPGGRGTADMVARAKAANIRVIEIGQGALSPSPRCCGAGGMMRSLKRHERMALEYLSRTPDRIQAITDDSMLAAAILYCDLADRGLVTIDKEDGMLVTISPAGLAALGGIAHASPSRRQGA